MKKSLSIVVVLLTFCVSAFAQEKEKQEHIIDYRQRFLFNRRDSHNGLEVVDSFRTLHLVVAGNIYQTEQHQAYAYDTANSRYNFKSQLRYVQPILGLGDVTIANLKTCFANDVTNMFSAPDEFALALKYTGITTLVHANILTANIDKAALSRTRDLLYSFDMLHTGAFSDNMQRNGNFPLMIDKKGFRIALLNYCNLGTRPGISRDFVINEISKTQMEYDMRMAKAAKCDFIIVYFDWGTVSQTIPSAYQINLAQYAFDLGADLIVGSDPNMPLRVDYLTRQNFDDYREGVVAYSLGNLIASSNEQKNRSGYLIDMELKKNNYTSATRISDWGIIPVYTYFDTTTTPGKTKLYSVPSSAIENGDIFANIPYIEKRRVVNSAFEIRKMLGGTADEIQYNLNEMVVNNVEESIHLTQASLNNKFSQKREKEIAPSEAPVLPVAEEGSNKAPSLSALFADSVTSPEKTAKAPSTAYDALKQMSEMVFIEDVPAPRAEEKAIEVAANEVVSLSAKTSNVGSEIKPVQGKELALQIDTVYRIQFYALNKKIPLDTNYYTHLKGYEVYEEDGMFKYLLGNYKNYAECVKYWREQILPRYRQSFIVKYIHGKRYLK